MVTALLNRLTIRRAASRNLLFPGCLQDTDSFGPQNTRQLSPFLDVLNFFAQLGRVANTEIVADRRAAMSGQECTGRGGGAISVASVGKIIGRRLDGIRVCLRPSAKPSKSWGLGDLESRYLR